MFYFLLFLLAFTSSRYHFQKRLELHSVLNEKKKLSRIFQFYGIGVLSVLILFFISTSLTSLTQLLVHSTSLTLNALCISESCIKIKIKLNFYFRTSLWWLKRFYEGLWCIRRFYEGLKGLHKIFWGITKKCENKNLT